MVEQAFGLPNMHFVNALLHVSPGHDVQDKQATEEGLGGEEKALVKQRDFNSFQKSPKWIDPFMVSIDRILVAFYTGSDDLSIQLYTVISLQEYTVQHSFARPCVVRSNPLILSHNYSD